MPNPNALVDFVAQTVQPREAATTSGRGARLTAVAFQGGRSGLLDVSDPRGRVWSEVLESLRRENQPVYVEIDPATTVITNLLVPTVVRVAAITPEPRGDGVEVALEISSARHYLRRSNPDYEHLLRELEAARAGRGTVAVTETAVEHEIIDVRPVTSPSAAEPSGAGPPIVEAPVTVAAVTSAQAQQMFDLAYSKVCCPGVAAAPCIPFTFPDDGCWGRAHEMCRLMIAAGVQPNKVWIFGNLHPKTQNHPSCSVGWGWHVAPTLDVAAGGGSATYVIDPSLADGPVPQQQWKDVQLDPAAALIASPASVFYRNRAGTVIQTDPTYAQTNAVLNTYRNQLKVRATGPSGPPPYPACMAARPNVQFTGVLPPNGTGRWFTFNWPASWHVVWTMMPLTICWGGAEISWSVAVERASAAYVTYWLTVTNLTASPVRFEGRYDILSR